MRKSASVSDRMGVAEKRYGKTLGASKGIKPAPKVKTTVNPKGSMKNPGVKAKAVWKF